MNDQDNKVEESTYSDKERKAYLSSGTVIRQFHESGKCYGVNCPVHSPSNHEYRHLPLDWRMGSFIRISDEFEHGFTIDPDDYAYNSQQRVIFRNSAHCNACGDDVESLHQHDFKRCSCKGVGVDGGHSYLRRVIGNEGLTHVDTSIVFTNPKMIKP